MDNKKSDDNNKDPIQVSDVFLNMDLPNEKKEASKEGKDKDSNEKEDEEDADFERDEEADVENVSEEPDTGNKVSNHTIIKRSKNQVNVSVKIYTQKDKKKKKKGKKSKKKKAEEPQPPNNPNYLLDVLFAFIGVSSKDNRS